MWDSPRTADLLLQYANRSISADPATSKLPPSLVAYHTFDEGKAVAISPDTTGAS
jgi:hypothetical protein